MLRFDLTDTELKEMSNKIFLSDIQVRIIEYRMRDLSIVQMADLEHCSPSRINCEVRKIRHKLEKM